jgi:2-aminoadipate transaminase
MPITSDRFSREAAQLQRSVMRELIRVIAQPDILSLAGGLPASDLLPADELRQCFDVVLRREGGDALQYRPRYSPLLEWIAAYMQLRGVICEPEQVFITNGNQQGLTIITRLLLDPGSVAVTDAITFTGVQQAITGRGATIRSVPVDLATGTDTGALEAAFRAEPHPRLAVLIPDFHNPLGVSLTAEKRADVAQLAAAYSVPLIEDDPYSALRFAGEPLLPVKAHDAGEYVFYLGSFSKMLAPAARLGWMIAPPELIPQLAVLRESIDLESSALMQRAVGEFLARGLLDAHLEQLNSANRERCAAMLDALETHFRDTATWTQPEGGLFVWVTLNADVNTWALLDETIRHKVAYIPGAAFAVDGGYRNTLRLNFSSLPPEQIHTGVERIAGVLRAHSVTG